MIDKLEFKALDDEGNVMQCEVLFLFQDADNRRHYIVYTDHSQDENGNTKVYASIIDPDSVMSYGSGLSAVGFHPIESEEEWEVIQAALDHLQEDYSADGSCE